jgi:hypothetical protein
MFMRSNLSISLFLFIVICFFACKKNSSIDQELMGPDPVLNFDTKEVSVIVPSNSSFKPSGSTILSLGTEQQVNASGKSRVAFEKGSYTIAYVFDNNKKLVLAGFITDSTNVISTASTAKVLLYLGYNIPLQPDTLSNFFINNVNKMTGYQDWEKEFESLFNSDPLTLSNKSFVTPLKNRMAKFMERVAPIEILGKAADIHVDANDIKSGIQVSEDGFNKAVITNWYRRRAHAFLYKMSYKDMNSVQHTVKERVHGKADKEMAVDPASAATGVLSEIGKNIEGKSMETFKVTSGPLEIELKDNESEALYNLRVVGPGRTEVFGLTSQELDKLLQLQIETFLLDFVVPSISLIASAPQKPTGAWPEAEKNQKTDALLTLLKSLPDVNENIKKGEYKAAIEKLLQNAIADRTGELMKELFKIALNKELSGKVSSHFTKNFEKFMYILGVFDTALGASDLIRIATNIYASKWLDSWDVKATASKVTLSPKNSSVIPFRLQKISATIKNLSGAAYYEWKTTGKYGKLTDTKGHKDLASFSSSDKDVIYESKVSSTSLSDGDNIDYIYVTALVDGIKVGTDTAIINVKKNRYEMQPTGITLSGKEGANHTAKLYLLKPDGGNDIKPNNDVDYKVIWTTDGKHGKLHGKDARSIKTLTVYNDNAAWYECMDKDTKEGTEIINVKIYSKPKSASDNEYVIFDEVQGTIKINNDPKKKIMHIPAIFVHGDTTSGPFTSFPSYSTYYLYSCHKATIALVPEVKDAIHYSLRFYGQNPKVSGAVLSASWTPQNLSYSSPPHFVIPKYANGAFAVTYAWGGTSGPNEGRHSLYTGSGGMAEVIVTLN